MGFAEPEHSSEFNDKRFGVVIFDGDDTLWETEPLYDTARAQSAAIVRSLGLDGEKFEPIQRKVDVRNVDLLGLSPIRFPSSSVEAYRILETERGRRPDETVARRIYEASAKVFSAIAPLLPHAEQVLTDLRSSHRLALVTKGDNTVQEKRIADSGLRSLFDLIEIVREKDQKTLMRTLRGLDSSVDEAWSVGNSLPSDVAPALDIGMRAVWIDAHVWAHERRPTKTLLTNPRLFVARSLGAVPSIIRQSSIQRTQA